MHVIIILSLFNLSLISTGSDVLPVPRGTSNEDVEDVDSASRRIQVKTHTPGTCAVSTHTHTHTHTQTHTRPPSLVPGVTGENYLISHPVGGLSFW